MQAIYNKQGTTVAWLSGKDLFSTKGYFIGFVINNTVYNNRSEYCGTLKQSFFRDYHGNVVAFMDGAKGGPALPSLKSSPAKPANKARPSTKATRPALVSKPPKPSWSKLDWKMFIQQLH